MLAPPILLLHRQMLMTEFMLPAIEPSKTLSRLSDAKVLIPFPWNSAEPYEVGITTDDVRGLVKLSKLLLLRPLLIQDR